MIENTSDPVYVRAYQVGVSFGPAEEPGRIACHLAMELPAPIGRLHVVLEPDQMALVHDVLHQAITMTDEQVRDFVNHVRMENPDD
ncbi:hypothetical protein JDV09_21065 [Mycobacterium sp. Y57]|uniref:hypothetical protein n=1 Tax=Mycolicibacterium xanthum TaxID=2796469 RepID=UPI001C84AB56|nr:hypothetical protein [Mycolicibacterium xanthum]MBX7434568.1 hypothetical protein [Mycolicibacterium xanthum]